MNLDIYIINYKMDIKDTRTEKRDCLFIGRSREIARSKVRQMYEHCHFEMKDAC